MSARSLPISLRLVAPSPAPAARSANPGFAARPAWNWLLKAMQARRTRTMLAQMDDRMLADIGVSRCAARTEAARAPWDIDLQA